MLLCGLFRNDVCRRSSASPTGLGEHNKALVRQIQHCLIREKTVALLIHFIWIPSNIGLHKRDYVDNLAKSACTLPIPDDASTITTGRVKTPLKKAALQTINEERSKQRGAGVSVRHYCKHCGTKYQYSRNKCLTRLSDAVAAMLGTHEKSFPYT
ncbi:hypothetical protein Hamer_G021764 [Homarus americanus]|uniref:Uncharacterized protein n=1 Tax=Homarus americanus TaxID=6706 RepID=A0A8J5K0K2_HOMAM|nr:hypothetical protein Hamer_G021764 [Homarus americanus]